ncbi:DUF6541 family protein [uncultured Olegusella sp.]|uniref:DUF6541 family protein n=1 Tax=uncultured Olegusella sp. TaxID=1979846 RepID=UPI0026223757|nr:DUF6541 family protein [uncultured Olegusella sp.]
MWIQFFWATVFTLIFVYLPGYLCVHALHFDPISSWAAAPLVTTVLVSLIGLCFVGARVFATWLNIFGVLLLLAVLAQILSKFFFKTNKDYYYFNKTSESMQTISDELKIFLPYLIFGIIVCLLYFIKPLDGPLSFSWKVDNTKHLNLVWRFVKDGNWSMMTTSLTESLPNSIPIRMYYPAAWHMLAAIPVSAFSLPSPFGANVLNALLIAIVLPSNSYYFLRTLLSQNSRALRFGFIFPLAFGVFPWRIIVPQAKYGFFFGMVLLPVALAFFIQLIEHWSDSKQRKRFLVLFVLSVLALICAHPGVVFTLGVSLIPLIIWKIWNKAVTQALIKNKKVYIRGVLACMVFIIFVALVWFGCLHVPPVKAMTTFVHYRYARLPKASFDAALLGFKQMPVQPVLAVLVWVGFIRALSNPRYRWATLSFLSFIGLYLVCGTIEGPIKQALTGFWYTDYDRIASGACFIAVFFATLGMDAFVQLFKAAVRLVEDSEINKQLAEHITTYALVVLVTLLVFSPSITPYKQEKQFTSFGQVYKLSKEINSPDQSMLSKDERLFLKKVKAVVGSDLVINIPTDGSAFAYALDDINVYYKRFYPSDATPDAAILSTRLKAFSRDQEVQQTLRDLDAHYVLLLDNEFKRGYQYREKLWPGFFGISDKTPGFTVVLSESDMRLYRLELK